MTPINHTDGMMGLGRRSWLATQQETPDTAEKWCTTLLRETEFAIGGFEWSGVEKVVVIPE